MQPERSSISADRGALYGALLGTLGDGGGKVPDVVIGDISYVFIKDLDVEGRCVGHIPDLP